MLINIIITYRHQDNYLTFMAQSFGIFIFSVLLFTCNAVGIPSLGIKQKSVAEVKYLSSDDDAGVLSKAKSF